MIELAATVLVGWICVTTDINIICTATGESDWPVGSEVICDKNGSKCEVTYYEDPYDNNNE